MREEDSRQKYTLCHVAQLIKNNVGYLSIITYNDFKIRPPLTYC